MSISSCTATSRAGVQNGSATPKHLGAGFGISPCTQKEYIMKSKTFNKGRSRVNSQLLSNGEAVLRAAISLLGVSLFLEEVFVLGEASPRRGVF